MTNIEAILQADSMQVAYVLTMMAKEHKLATATTGDVARWIAEHDHNKTDAMFYVAGILSAYLTGLNCGHNGTPLDTSFLESVVMGGENKGKDSDEGSQTVVA